MTNALLLRLLNSSRSPRNLASECLGFGNGGGSSVRTRRQISAEATGLRAIEKPSFRRFSTGYTSVHGERPSSEYAKRRKESLETEFGQILGTYRSKTLFAYRRFGPFLALYRAAIISFQVAKLIVCHLFVQDVHRRAAKFRETLIHLGPFYIKLGQALSTRPDILPKIYCQELSKLQDQIPPFSTRVAIKSIESQLGAPISQIFSDISPEPIAAASLGQVYKGIACTTSEFYVLNAFL